MNEVNKGVFVACYCDYDCDKMMNFMCKFKGQWKKMSGKKKKGGNGGTVHDP